jgi:hypothetical protein
MPVFSIRASIILDANGVRTKNHLTGYETALVELGRFVVKEKASDIFPYEGRATRNSAMPWNIWCPLLAARRRKECSSRRKPWVECGPDRDMVDSLILSRRRLHKSVSWRVATG